MEDECGEMFTKLDWIWITLDGDGLHPFNVLFGLLNELFGEFMFEFINLNFFGGDRYTHEWLLIT